MLRAAGRVVDVDEVGVDAEVAVDGGQHLALVYGTLGRVAAEAVGSVAVGVLGWDGRRCSGVVLGSWSLAQA